MGDEVKQKLNKETLEPVLAQIEYLKGIKKDHLIELYKAFDGKVTQEDIEEFVKLFQTLDTEEKNEVPVSQLGTMMRMLQQIPTDNEVNQLADDINPEKKENISFYQFVKAMSLIMRDPEEIADEVKKAFKVLDRHKQGYIMIANIRELADIK
jgi:Ca2+-binding EF-hand superfamily protein